ncbi:hypothetical protein, partial [Vibrio crassostreae]|uniref:hypothetical protein n=1 Tax=Vibrio crassostreae TaxID=246167 RepID=UPI001BD46AEC
ANSIDRSGQVQQVFIHCATTTDKYLSVRHKEKIVNIQELIDRANNLEHQLYIKYSLVTHPQVSDIQNWVKRTEAYMSDGDSLEAASCKAALEAFEVDPRIIRKSQTDTIEALLAMAKAKVDEETKNNG